MTAAVDGLVAASSARLVYMLAGLLVLLGAGMVVLTIWLVRSTRPDPEVLVRLEVMGTRRWRKAGTKAREAQLNAMREDGVEVADGDGHHDAADSHDGADEVDAGSPDHVGASDEVGDGDEPGDDEDSDETVPIVAGPHADQHEDAENTEKVELDESGQSGQSDEVVKLEGDSPAEPDDTPSKGMRPPAADASP